MENFRHLFLISLTILSYCSVFLGLKITFVPFSASFMTMDLLTPLFSHVAKLSIIDYQFSVITEFQFELTIVLFINNEGFHVL